MKYILLGFLFLIALTAAVVLGFYYWRFRHSPQGLWRDRVLRRLSDLKAQIRPLDRPTDTRTRGARLGEKLFRTHLQSIPTSALLGFPGIGPGTVDRLLGAGLPTLASLVDYDYERIPGFGPVKAGDVKSAVRKLWNDAKARFDAGGCAEGREYQKLWSEMAAADRAETAGRRRKNDAVEKAIVALEPLVRTAEDATFWNHLLHKGHVPGLTEEAMDRPLPEIVEEPAPPAPVLAAAVPVAPPVREPALAGLAAKAANGSIAPEHPLLPKLRAYCAFALVVAKSDGKIAQSERREVRELLASTFGHDLALVRFIDPVMERIEKAVPDEDVALADILKQTTAEERRRLYAVAEKIADAAGERGPREADALRRIAAALDLTVAASFQPVATAEPRPVESRSPHSVLEIDSSAPLSPELIRRRFTLLTERADPAKAAPLGPEFAAMAEAKRAEIRRAALQLLEPFGEALDAPAAPAPPSDPRHNPDLDDAFGA